MRRRAGMPGYHTLHKDREPILNDTVMPSALYFSTLHYCMYACETIELLLVVCVVGSLSSVSGIVKNIV